jgi:hypothetical protein
MPVSMGLVCSILACSRRNTHTTDLSHSRPHTHADDHRNGSCASNDSDSLVPRELVGLGVTLHSPPFPQGFMLALCFRAPTPPAALLESRFVNDDHGVVVDADGRCWSGVSGLWARLWLCDGGLLYASSNGFSLAWYAYDSYGRGARGGGVRL